MEFVRQMSIDGLGAGLASIAFWGFVAVAVAAGVWDSVRKREARHETVRRLIESGKSFDKNDMDKLLGEDKNTGRDLKIAGIIVIFSAAGLLVFSWFIGIGDTETLNAMTGISALVAFVGLGLLVAARMIGRDESDI